MARETENFKPSLNEITKESCDFGHPLTDFSRMSDKQLEAYQEQLTSYIAGHMAGLRNTFQALASCPESGKFAEFFDHCKEMKNKGEPAYVLMYQEA